MGASRRAIAAGAALAVSLAACDALLGLDQYQNVACATPADCPDAPDEASPPDAADAGLDAETGTVTDSQPGMDVTNEAQPPEGGYPVPFAHEIWVHWHMPNPDAAIAPDFPDAGTLPNQASYTATDGGADGGLATVLDDVTLLTWSRDSFGAMSLDQAWGWCVSLGASWRVPTRIELVSLVDFTQPSGSATIDPAAFPNTMTASYWTSSPVPSGGVWSVSFQTGLAAYPSAAANVRCVKGGAAQ
jgi:hypothetical protein